MNIFTKKYIDIYASNKLFSGLVKVIKIFLISLFFNFSQLVLASDYSDFQDVGITSLMQSAANNDVEGVKFFTRISASKINQQNIGGATALHIAVRNNNIEIVKILLNFGADVNKIDNDGFNPAMRAAYLGNSEILKILLDKNTDVSKLNNKAESLIIQSAASGCDECLQVVLAKVVPSGNFEVEELKNQLSQAFTVASWRDNQKQKEILLQFLDKLSKDFVKKEFIIKQETTNVAKVETSLEPEPKKVESLVNSGSQEKFIDIAPENNEENKRNKKVYIFKIGEAAIPAKVIEEESPKIKTKTYKLITPNDEQVTKSSGGKVYKFKAGDEKSLHKKRRAKIKKPVAIKQDEATMIKEEIILELKENDNQEGKIITFDGKNVRSQNPSEIKNSDQEIDKTFIIK